MMSHNPRTHFASDQTTLQSSLGLKPCRCPMHVATMPAMCCGGGRNVRAPTARAQSTLETSCGEAYCCRTYCSVPPRWDDDGDTLLSSAEDPSGGIEELEEAKEEEEEKAAARAARIARKPGPGSRRSFAAAQASCASAPGEANSAAWLACRRKGVRQDGGGRRSRITSAQAALARPWGVALAMVA